LAKNILKISILCILLMLAVFSSGCTDSDDVSIDEVDAESATDMEPEEVADDSTLTNSIGMEFVMVESGEFTRGSPDDELYSDKDERPTRQVTVSNDFYIGVYEVTQQEWKTVMGTEPFDFKGNNLPADKVSWSDAIKFIEKLNQMEETDSYRLPTESEWEYAARAGTNTAYTFGSNEAELFQYAWFTDNSEDETHSVGMKEANAWGLYDVHGNLAEWVMDEYHSNYQNAPSDSRVWEGGVDRRVIRGGSWDNAAENCRSGHRDSMGAGSRKNYIGFRIVKEV
jgi:formylglycine-generating enzyme required for sulfatase activity